MAEARLYTPGGKVQAHGGLYLERRADKELARLCHQHAFAYVLYSRQVGKSSLLANVAAKLEAGGARVVVVDLTQIGTNVTAEQWYWGLVFEIAGKLGLDDDAPIWWEQHAALGFTQRVRKYFADVLVPAVGRDVFIFLDEIDTTVPLGFTDDFFAAIRELYQARDREPQLQRLTFVLAGSTSPNDLIRDPDRTPFNIGSSVELSDFTLEEALPLAAGLSEDRAQARRILGWIFDWTAGHPYLTQMVCADVAAANEPVRTAAGVGEIVAARFLRTQGDQDKNLAYVTDMLTERAGRLGEGAVLREYRRILVGREVADDRQSPVLAHLELSGIVLAKDGVLVVRNRIYAEAFNRAWVDQHLPVNWKKVARAALAALPVITVPFAIVALVLWQHAETARGKERDARAEAQRARDEAVVSATEAKRARDAAELAAEAERRASAEAKRREQEAKDALEAAKSARDARDQALEALQKKNGELAGKYFEEQKKNSRFVAEFTKEIGAMRAQLKACEDQLGAAPAPAP